MSDFLKRNIEGILISLAVAIPAYAVVQLVDGLKVIGAPIIAILAGMIIAVAVKDGLGRFKPGMSFTSKYVLQLAVVLLGFGLNLATVGKVGLSSLPVILSTITTSLLVAYVLYKILKTPAKTSTLIGVGSSICGGSAIAATAPVVKANNEEIAQSIAVIFLFNVIAAIIFPTLGDLLGMSNEGFALFAGTAVNDTSSVTAAASTWDAIHGTGSEVLDGATIVKLTRTLFIIPIVVILSLIMAKKDTDGTSGDMKGKLKNAFPKFILFFILASVITTIATSVLTGNMLDVAQDTFAFLKKVSAFMIVVAMAAIGLNTDIVKLVKTGGKPILIGFCCWVSITAVSLAVQAMMGVW